MTMFEHASKSEQLKMFMTPREIMENYGPHDADRWITGTNQPDGIGTMGDRFTHPPLMMMARPEQYGIIPTFDDPRKDADDYIERWHATKAKFDRGEKLDEYEDVSYEPGDLEPGTRAAAEEYGGYNEEWTERENYLEPWLDMHGVEGVKEDMKYDEFTGSIDDYFDEKKRLHYDAGKAAKQYNLKDDHDPSTWFESDSQYWKRALQQAKKPTDELANEARAEGEPETFSMFPEGLGAFARVGGMGVEQPVTLGLDPEVSIRRDIKRPIWGGEHDIISAYTQKPDVLIPVQHTGRTGSYGSIQNELYPHAERQEGWEGSIEVEKDEIAAKADIDRAIRSAHIDLMRMDEGGEEEVRRRFPHHQRPGTDTTAFWDVQPPTSIPGQMSLFD